MHDKSIERFQEYLYQRRYSLNTIKSYSEALKSFIKFMGGRTLEDATLEDLHRFNYECIIQRKLSASYQNQVINALKLYYRKFHNRKFDTELIERPKNSSRLPVVLSLAEVERILNGTTNLKHRAMLTVIYSCGLRMGELLNMRVEDVDSQSEWLFICIQQKCEKIELFHYHNKLWIC